MSTVNWEVGQTVNVQSRTWAGINRPGGCARITKVHYAKDGRSVQSVDVKYVVGNGSEKEIEPSLMRPFETLERDGRKRRGRDFLMAQADEVVKKVKHAISQQQQQKKTTKRVTTNDTKNVTVTPMDKTQGQPDHSTSLSTPITPEHPSMIKDKKSSSKPVIVRTVPSFIIANSSSMEVSPLQEPMNRGIDASKKTTLVRRGLFGASSSSTTNKQQQRPQQQQQQVPKKPSIAAAKENQKENSKVEYDAEEEDLTSSSSSASSPILPKSSQEVQKAHSEALKLSLSKKQSKFILSSKKKEVPTTSADRTNTMVATAASNDKTASLRNVFDEERRKARQFLEEVFQAPHNDIKELDEEVVGDRSSTESRLDTSGSEQDDHEYGKPPVSTSTTRREEFLNLFGRLRGLFDDEDGAMEELAFRALIGQKADKPFTPQELDDNLDYLYKEGKLMKSEGILYVIY